MRSQHSHRILLDNIKDKEAIMPTDSIPTILADGTSSQGFLEQLGFTGIEMRTQSPDEKFFYATPPFCLWSRWDLIKKSKTWKNGQKVVFVEHYPKKTEEYPYIVVWKIKVPAYTDIEGAQSSENLLLNNGFTDLALDETGDFFLAIPPQLKLDGSLWRDINNKTILVEKNLGYQQKGKSGKPFIIEYVSKVTKLRQRRKE